MSGVFPLVISHSFRVSFTVSTRNFPPPPATTRNTHDISFRFFSPTSFNREVRRLDSRGNSSLTMSLVVVQVKTRPCHRFFLAVFFLVVFMGLVLRVVERDPLRLRRRRRRYHIVKPKKYASSTHPPRPHVVPPRNYAASVFSNKRFRNSPTLPEYHHATSEAHAGAVHPAAVSVVVDGAEVFATSELPGPEEGEDSSDPQQESTPNRPGANRTGANRTAENNSKSVVREDCAPPTTGADLPTPLPLPTLLDSSEDEGAAEQSTTNRTTPPWSIAALALPADRTTLSYADWRRVFHKLKKNCTCIPEVPVPAIDPRPQSAQQKVSFQRWQPPRPADADNAML